MDFKQLQSFVTVVRYGSFTKAAASLGISQPTISTHVRVLEEELGTPLVLRTAKHVELTPQGSRVFEQAATMIAMRDRMLEAMQSRERNAVYLGTSSIPSAYILPEALPAYARLHPDTRFLIYQHDSQDIMSGLTEGVYDVGLTGMPTDEATLECTAFCTDRMVLVTPPAERFSSLRGDAAEVARTILTTEHVVIRNEGSGSRATMDSILEGMDIPEGSLDIVARVNDQETIKNLVESGFGVTVVSSRAVRDRVTDGRLLQFELPCAASERSLYLAYRKNATFDEHAHDFITFLRLHYAG